MIDRKMIGEKLRKLREGKKKTIVEVAGEIGISPSALTAYELGDRRPKDDMKVIIAKYYGQEPGALFFDDDCHES